VSRRKPYLATQDYVGPDRRGGREDPNAPGVALIHPPNTLRAKLEGRPLTRDDLGAQVRATQLAMAEQRLGRDVARVINLTKAVDQAGIDGRRDGKLVSELDQLAQLGRDLAVQVTDTPLESLIPILSNLRRTAEALRDALPGLDLTRVKLLLPMGEAVSAAMGSAEARRRVIEVAAALKEIKTARERLARANEIEIE